jgi:prepilin-type N-terminal cleavage/methylation domain-containing protein
MEMRSWIGWRAFMRKQLGFTFVEAMISMAVIAIIASISVFSLAASQRTDQLNTAAQVVVADLRSLQSSALSSENIKTCAAGGKNITCEQSMTACDGGASSCTPQSPAAVGVEFKVNQPSYDFFAEVEPSTAGDWALTTGSGEKYLTRSLAQSGAPNVRIVTLSVGSPTDVAFERQNGSMVINGCRVSQGCSTHTSLTVVLQQTQSLETRTITMNAFTGRISIQ